MTDRDKARRLFHNARREAVIVLVTVALALAWTVGYCYLHGYRHAPDSWLVEAGLASHRTGDNLQQILGMPDWIFMGVVLPWLVCTAFTVYFGIRIMADDDLGEEAEGRTGGH